MEKLTILKHGYRVKWFDGYVWHNTIFFKTREEAERRQSEMTRDSNKPTKIEYREAE